MPIVTGDGGGDGIPLAGIVAGYHFDEDTGTSAADFTGNGHAGTLSGGAWTFGHLHYGFDFGAGANGVCHIGALGSFYKTAFTLAAWVQKQSAQWDSNIVGSWIFANGGGPLLWIDDTTGKLSLALTNDFNNYVYPNFVMPTGWHHCAGTWDGATGKLYLDGIQIGEHAFAGNVGDTDDFYIGYDPGQVANTFDGIIDEVVIYRRALSQAEIRTLMAAT